MRGAGGLQGEAVTARDTTVSHPAGDLAGERHISGFWR